MKHPQYVRRLGRWILLCGWLGFVSPAMAQVPDIRIPPPPTDLRIAPPVLPEGRITTENLGEAAAKAIRAGNWKEAEKALRKYLAEKPQSREAVIALGTVLLRDGRANDAVEFLSAQIEAFPGDAQMVGFLGRALLEVGDVCAALDWLLYAAHLNPDLPDLNYLLGVAYLRANYPLSAFWILSGGPTSDHKVALQQELARGTALARLGLHGEAAYSFQSVAAETDDAAIRNSAYQLQGELDNAVFGTNPWGATVKATIRHDDNIGVVPGTNIFGTPLAQIRSWGDLFLGEVTYDVCRDYNRQWVAGYDILHVTNYETHAFDIVDNAVFLAGARSTLCNCKPTVLGLRFDYDYLTVGSDSFLQRGGVTPSITITDSDVTASAVQARYTKLDFLGQGTVDGTAFDADSQDVAVGVFRQRQICCRDVTLQGGYIYDHNFSEGSDFDFNGQRVTAGATWQLPVGNIQLQVNGQIFWRDYENPQFVNGAFRNDQEYILQTLLLVPLCDRMFLTAEWFLDRNTSNLVAFDYERQVFELGLQYNFGAGGSRGGANRYYDSTYRSR